jgi:hypothetical protein
MLSGKRFDLGKRRQRVMDQISEITQKIDKKAGGNIQILNFIYKAAMKQIRRTCGSEEEFDIKCREFLDTICSRMGEEHREFYAEYMAKVNKELS